MGQYMGLVSIVVDDYDRARNYYCDTLGFALIEDEQLPEENKRWVVVAPRQHGEQPTGAALLLAQATSAEQRARIGNQTGGRVFLFLYTDDFASDYARFVAAGVTFVRNPEVHSYGIVAVFEDLYGNQWDLLERA